MASTRRDDGQDEVMGTHMRPSNYIKNSNKNVQQGDSSVRTIHENSSVAYEAVPPDENLKGGSAKAVKGVLRPNNMEDCDQVTSFTPAVVHETLHPHVHEIKEEQIHRDIHNHDIYHRIQPVYDIEVRPARHFVSGINGELIEVSEADIPGCTGDYQNWYIAKREPPAAYHVLKDLPELLSGKAAPEKKHMDPEPIMRTETTVIHPPTLEDISTVSGPVLPVYFDKHGRGHTMPIRDYVKETGDKDG